jgi:steroid delta-isomerase-like uncharacterized protein
MAGGRDARRPWTVATPIPFRADREAGVHDLSRTMAPRAWRNPPMTSVQDNKALVRRFIDEIFVAGRTEAVDELLADDFVGHTWPSTGDPKADLKAAIGRTSKGLSDPRFVVEDMIGEGDEVAVRLTAEATQTGELMGMPASGKRYSIGEIHIFRVRDGKVAEHWHQFDQMTMMRQLGAMPAAGASPASNGQKAQTGEPAAAR